MKVEQIFISRSQLKQALKTLSIASHGKFMPEMVFYCRENRLYIHLGGSEVQIEGYGRFDGQARISGKSLKQLMLALPEEDLLSISRFPNQLGVGNLHLSCEWDTNIPAKIPIAINADDLDYLRITKENSYDEIVKSGLGPMVEAAAKDFNERIQRAYNLLKVYGVEFQDLYKLVDQSLEKIFKDDLDNE